MFISYKNNVWRSVFGRQSEEEGHYWSQQQQTQAQKRQGDSKKKSETQNCYPEF